jgi:hypothetical protein
VSPVITTPPGISMHPTSSAPPSVRVVRVPTVGDVASVAGLRDPVVRNLRITHAYHLLAVHLAGLTGTGANWCTFAVWASRQAGRTIRGEDLLDALEPALRHDPGLVERINRLWRRVFVAAVQRRGSRRSLLVRILSKGSLARASDAVARGNRKVFEEIAREFARFAPLCAGGRVDPAALAAFLDGLAPGPAPDGQELLRHAFSHYAAALEAEDANTRAELLLLANLEVGLHEQTRLQPQILEALEVPFATISELGHLLLGDLFPSSRRWSRPVRAPAALVLGAVARSIGPLLRGVLRHLITERLMTLALPGTVVHLGRDLAGECPACLREPRTAELVELLARFTPPADDRDGAGACDWSVLDQRMQLIARLFRLHHEDATLFQPAYTPEQVLAFEAGRLPEGDL